MSHPLRAQKGEWDHLEKDQLLPLTFRSKLHVGAVMLGLLPRAMWWTALHYWPGSSPAHHLRKELYFKVGKHIVRELSDDEIRLILPAVPLRVLLDSPVMDKASLHFENYNHYFDVQDASARWVTEVPDRKPEDPVILYLHGGAFFFKTVFVQVYWLASFVRRMKPHRVSVLAVDYTVTPYAQYPTQLNQALAVYKKLVESSTRIIVLGDSAGGNLAAVLQKRIQAERLPEPFGFVLASPWMRLTPDGGSFHTNRDRDYLPHDHILRYALSYAGSEENLQNPLVQPALAGPEFWGGVFGPRAICVWGEYEVLADSCEKFAKDAGIKGYCQPYGVHDVVAYSPRTRATAEIIREVKDWLGPQEVSKL